MGGILEYYPKIIGNFKKHNIQFMLDLFNQHVYSGQLSFQPDCMIIS